jgi:hypothetical protein
MRGGPLAPGECELLAALTEHVDRVLAGTPPVTDRERAFQCLVSASHIPADDTRRLLVHDAARVLTVDEIYHANTVIALFNFYNKFVDLNGVDELTPEGYAASGERLSTHGYAPPAAKVAGNDTPATEPALVRSE